VGGEYWMVEHQESKKENIYVHIQNRHECEPVGLMLIAMFRDVT
jgi:hypothetical protein